jgi:hypothetical protein
LPMGVRESSLKSGAISNLRRLNLSF